MKDNSCRLSEEEIKRLIKTPDDELLKKFPSYTRSYLRQLKKSPAKILLLDIETSQMITKVWQLRGNEYIEPSRIIDDWFMLCWSAKWLFDKHIFSDRLTSEEAKAKDDKRIAQSIWRLLDEADIVVAHNGDSFDIKKLNTRFLKYRLPHPNYYRSIDTLKIVKKEFRISSNKLDYVCKFLGLDTKINTGGIDLWDSCEKGDEQALKKISRYCDNDVKILEELYLYLRPYIRNHPNLELYVDGNACPNCGSLNLEEAGLYRTQKQTYTSYRCECGSLCYKRI